MQYSFNCYGHKNITAMHKTTLEFTKDNDLSLNGDCIVGIKADFSLKDIKKFIENKINNQKFNKIKDYNSIKKLKNKIIKNRINKNNSILKTNNLINKNAKNNLKIKNEISNRKINKISIKIIIKIDEIEENIYGFLNPNFDDEKEIVIRKSDFISERTLTVNSNKGADDLKNEMKNLLKNDEKKINILLK